MAVITVPMSGLQVSDTTLDDTLQAGPDVVAGSTTYFEVDGTSTLKSLFIGSSIEVDVGSPFGSPAGSLTGTGNVTGNNDPAGVLPALVNNGTLDINGTIAVALTNNGTLTVAAGERLDLEGDLYSVGATTLTVAAGAELDLNSQNSALVANLSANGTVKVSGPSTALSGATTLATLVVQGDAANAAAGTAGSPYVAKLELEQATFATPINSVTLGQDAQIRFGNGPTTVQQLTIAGSSTAAVPLDLVIVDGTLVVSGSAAVSMAEFSNGGTIDFTAAGGASLQRQLVVDANTTLRNDAAMTIGGQGAATTSIGAANAAAGSSFINGAAGQLTIAAGASLSVAAIQNAGAIVIAGNTSFLRPIANTGTIDVTSGTLALDAAPQGTGTIAVETGAALSVDTAFAQGGISLRSGSLLRLLQPSSFGGTIQAPATGAAIEFANSAVTSATVANGSIVVTTGTGTVSLAETGLVTGTPLSISMDQAGDSFLTIAATTPVPPTTPAGGTSPGTSTQAHPSVYRFFDDVHGTQFLTASLSESQMLQSARPDLVYEGVGLASDDPATDPAAAPVYRFFDGRFGTHFYTASATERDTVLATRPDLVSEGVGFYEHATSQPGDVAVYRFFESGNGTHFYTSSATESATLAATRPDLVAEGISFYTPSA